MNASNTSTRIDIYTRVTAQVIEDLENGVRTWLKPWSADIDPNRISLPLRHNGVPYRGINVLVLWSEAVEKGQLRLPWDICWLS